MKKIISALLVLFLLIPCVGSAEEILCQFDQVFFRSQYLGENVAWVLDYDGNISRWDYDGNEPEHILTVPVVNDELFWNYGMPYGDLPLSAQEKMSEVVTLLAADGDKLFVINTYAGRIGTANSDGIKWTLSFDSAIFFRYDGWERSHDGSAVVMNHKAYILLGGDGQQSSAVIELDLETGAIRAIETNNSIRIAAYKPGALLHCVMEETGTNLYALDTVSGEQALLCAGIPATEALCYDSRTDTVYVGSDTGIYALGSKGFALRMNLPSSYLYGVGSITSDGKLAYCTEGIWVVKLPDDGVEIPTLTVYMQDAAPALTSMFTADYPNILLDVRMDYSMTAADISTRIRGGDDVTDVYSVKVDYAFSQLKEKGFTTSLQNQTILDGANQMHPSIAEVITNDHGQVVAYPWYVSMQGGWSVNKDLWQEYFGDAPYPVTWIEFFTLANEFHALESEDCVFVNHWSYPTMLRQVLTSFIHSQIQINGKVDFTDPVLQETLQVMKDAQNTLLRRGLEEYDEEMYSMDVDEMGSHSLFWPDYDFDSTYIRPNTGNHLPPFVFSTGDTPVYQGNAMVLIVNPLSQNKEMAENFIVALTKQEYSPMHYYMLHADTNLPVNNDRYHITTEDIVSWQEASIHADYSDLTPLLTPEFTEQMNILISRYAAGQIDLTIFLQKLNETARMVELESE